MIFLLQFAIQNKTPFIIQYKKKRPSCKHLNGLQVICCLKFNIYFVMSDQEVNIFSKQIVVTKRRVNRLNLDSEEEARLQEEERQRQEQIRLRKQQKRRRREQQAKKAQEQEKKRLELKRHYEDPQTMLQADSDSDDHFQRVQKKIKLAYPQYQIKKRQTSQSEQQESEQQSEEDSQSQEESSSHKKKVQKKTKKQRKQRRKQESQELRAPRQKVQKVKVEEKDPKEKLVGQVAIRWWYCLPEWPPADYNYEAQLNKLGYRLVQSNRFRMQENLVNGLFKATTIDGYVGIFKTKLKIIDLRPKQYCPSLQFLRSKSIGQLTSLLKTALKEQISQLANQQFQNNGDLELIDSLTRQLNSLNE